MVLKYMPEEVNINLIDDYQLKKNEENNNNLQQQQQPNA